MSTTDDRMKKYDDPQWILTEHTWLAFCPYLGLLFVAVVGFTMEMNDLATSRLERREVRPGSMQAV